MNFEDPELIRETVKTIQQAMSSKYYVDMKKYDDTMYEVSLRGLFPNFAMEYPFLFRKIIKGEDLSMLKKFLETIQEMKDGKLDEQTATEHLGEVLADQYYPEDLKNEYKKNIKGLKKGK